MPTPYALSSDLVSAWPAKSLAVAQYVDGYKLDTGPVQNAQTGTSYTFLLTDTTKTVTANNSAASAYTIPPQSSVVWEAYTVLRLVNLGAGVVTLTAGAGVTLTGNLTVPQYGSVSLMRTASNAWTISGNGGGGFTLVSEQSFTAVSAVNFTSLLTSTYLNYRLMFYSNNSGSTRIRLRSASTDDSSANYDNTGIISNSFNNDAAATSWRGLDLANASVNTVILDLLSPAIATATGVSITAFQSTPGTNQYVHVATGQHRAATAFDGVSVILGGSGAFTGTAKLYGYGGA